MRKTTMFLEAVFLTAALQIPPPPKAIGWFYNQAQIDAAAVGEFLVCLDGQATAACARVPTSAGVPVTGTPGEFSYTWTIPAVKPGDHTASVQACTLGAGVCSSGATVKFSLVIVPENVRGLSVK